MTEYIDKDCFDNTLFMLGYDKHDLPRRALAQQRAADVIQVVRCKNCNWYRDEGLCMNPHCGKSWYGCPVRPDHFCSYGERKEPDHD